MENGNEVPSDLVPPIRSSETVAHIDFDAINWQLGELQDADGNMAGLIFQFTLPPLPWFKFRVNMDLIGAAALTKSLNDKLEKVS